MSEKVEHLIGQFCILNHDQEEEKLTGGFYAPLKMKEVNGTIVQIVSADRRFNEDDSVRYTIVSVTPIPGQYHNWTWEENIIIPIGTNPEEVHTNIMKALIDKKTTHWHIQEFEKEHPKMKWRRK